MFGRNCDASPIGLHGQQILCRMASNPAPLIIPAEAGIAHEMVKVPIEKSHGT